ncbi:MAG: pyridoxamine 5'-phosphate oxidase family protein [Ilumatobacteraceae bacterium]
MGIKLTDAELWEFVATAHTGVLTTLNTAGYPIALPTWHVAFDERIYLRTVSKAAKVRRISRDDRVSFLVEDGVDWVDLRAALVVGHAAVVDDEDVADRARELLHDKYEPFRQSRRTALSDAGRRHYSAGEAIIEVTGDVRTISWANRKLRPTPEP